MKEDMKEMARNNKTIPWLMMAALGYRHGMKTSLETERLLLNISFALCTKKNDMVI
jgi:hypothetical protein